MNKEFDAVYEDGIFRPLEPVSLPEHQRVCVTVTEPTAGPAISGLRAAEDEEGRPWRGVWVVDGPRPLLFAREIETRTAELPAWEPHIVLNPRQVRDDQD